MNRIKCLITSKKALNLIKNKKYSFLVQCSVNKSQIKIILEKFFGIKVLSVNTVNLQKKKKKIR